MATAVPSSNKQLIKYHTVMVSLVWLLNIGDRDITQKSRNPTQ